MSSPTKPDSIASALTLCGSISRYPVSMGAAMHRAGYRALDLAFTYVPFAVSDLAGAVRGMRALGIRGLGVSMPFKLDVIPLIDELDPLARQIGAVNTIVNDDGHLVGHNTDWIGALRALEEVASVRDARVLLLGAGGAARAVAYGLQQRGAVTTIANRNLERAAILAREVGADARPIDEAQRAGDYDVVINASSVGMANVDLTSPIDASAIRPGMLIMDIVYKPIETALVATARRCGARVIHGGRMLLHQAARQFELYTGRDAPLEAMDTALMAQLTAFDTPPPSTTIPR
jgi:shikimate dehydrogenase